MARRYRPAPPPLEANEQVVTGLVTVGWAIALIVVVLLRHRLPPGESWWIWTCAIGFAMGLFGLWYVPRLKRGRARTAERQATAKPSKHATAEDQSRDLD
jgi:ABC-type nickel/cobalt efflux system permease component RcnA